MLGRDGGTVDDDDGDGDDEKDKKSGQQASVLWPFPEQPASSSIPSSVHLRLKGRRGPLLHPFCIFHLVSSFSLCVSFG
jgi:hypothetical protein